MKQFFSQLVAPGTFETPKLTTRLIAFSALLLAMDVVLYKIAIGPSYFQVTFGFISMALMGYFFGPWWAGLLEVISNFLNFTLFGSGTFQIAFLLTAFLGGFIDGTFLYKKKISLTSIITTQLLVMIPVSLLLNTWLISFLFNLDFYPVFIGRLFRNLLLIPIQIYGIYLVITKLEKNKLIKASFD